jgi:hypothetical protein
MIRTSNRVISRIGWIKAPSEIAKALFAGARKYRGLICVLALLASCASTSRSRSARLASWSERR